MRDYTKQPVQSIQDSYTRSIVAVIDYYLQDLSKGMARIQKGQVPDGSGDTIINTVLSDIYFVLKGRPVDQVAHGATRPGGTLTLASTIDSTKGKIYFGNAQQSTYDEPNDRFGVHTATPMARVHIKAGAGVGPQLLYPTTSAQNGWGLVGSTVQVALGTADSNDSTFIQSGDFSNPGIGSEWSMAVPADPGNGTGWTVNLLARKTGSVSPNAQIDIYQNRTYTASASAFSAGALILSSADFLSDSVLTTGYATASLTLSSAQATAILTGTTWSIKLTQGAGGNGTNVIRVTQAYLSIPGTADTTPLQRWETASGGVNDLYYTDDGGGVTELKLDGAPKLEIATSGLRFNIGTPVSGYVWTALDSNGLGAWLSAASGGGAGSSLGGITMRTFQANGYYRIDGDVDGAWIMPSAATLMNAILYRRAPGSSGGTTVDLLRNGVSVFALAPTISASAGASATAAGIFSSTTVSAYDRLTVSANAVEAGAPQDWAMLVEASLVSGASAASATGILTHSFIANGRYNAGSDVDGAWIVPSAVTLSAAILYRRAAGSSGATTVDLLRNGVSVFSAAPTISASAGASATALGTFSSAGLSQYDRLTVSASSVEAGSPEDWVLLVEAA